MRQVNPTNTVFRQSAHDPAAGAISRVVCGGDIPIAACTRAEQVRYPLEPAWRATALVNVIHDSQIVHPNGHSGRHNLRGQGRRQVLRLVDGERPGEGNRDFFCLIREAQLRWCGVGRDLVWMTAEPVVVERTTICCC